ncbi:MAG TPA: ScpA family protein [Caulobacteraceae bacterium]|nr:ScpA family protein [Caulobacteraceae bacterium]
MSETFQGEIDFDAASGAAAEGRALIIDLDGYEGPLDVLLALARSQKVDLLKLSITRLADQYLAFVREARSRSFALAADYLVMAAWLAYLKSRLLLPTPERPADEGRPPEEVAAALAFRLARLDAMRRASQALADRPILGRDVFARGDPQAVSIVSHTRLEGDLYALMAAYVGQRRRASDRRYSPETSKAYPLDDARARLRRLLTEMERWTPLTGVAPMEGGGGPSRASFIASTLSASLELVREGELEARQIDHFAEIYLRARRAAA